MEFSIVVETPEGDTIPLLSGTMNPQILPFFALKFAEVKRFIPTLGLVVTGHTLTELVFEPGNCRLRGEPVRWLNGIDN